MEWHEIVAIVFIASVAVLLGFISGRKFGYDDGYLYGHYEGYKRGYHKCMHDFAGNLKRN